MESRQEARFEVDQEVTVTVLGDVETVFQGKVVNVSGKGLCLLSEQELSPGAALKIELADTMVLGEIIYCRSKETGYCAGIALDQALYHTRDLAVLARRLLGLDTPSADLRQGGDARVKRNDKHDQEADDQHDRKAIGHVPAA